MSDTEFWLATIVGTAIAIPIYILMEWELLALMGYVVGLATCHYLLPARTKKART